MALQAHDRAVETTRRRLNDRQAALIEQLLEAAADEARERGYEGMTVRSAAKRAGVAPATAYTCFASKDHLLAEVLWQRMLLLPEIAHDPGSTALERVTVELRALALFMADDPQLAGACTTALLGSGPDVRSARLRFGNAVHSRIAGALGDDADPLVLQALDLAYSGAMLWGGMAHITFDEIPEVLGRVAKLLVEDQR